MTRTAMPQWYRFFPEDWWDGVYCLSIEEEGLYQRA